MAVVSRVKEGTVLANCLAADDVGDCVYVTAPPVGDYVQVSRVDPTDVNAKHSIGIITVKIDATTCMVRLSGIMRDVYTGMTSGERYWIGADSKLTDVKPAPAPSDVFHLQIMGVALGDEELLLNPQTPVVLRGT